LSEDKIKKYLKNEIEFAEKAISDRNIDLILTQLPGKALIAKISSISGARNPSDYARACTKHLIIGDYSQLVELKTKLKFE
jgi:hypothetical protein